MRTFAWVVPVVWLVSGAWVPACAATPAPPGDSASPARENQLLETQLALAKGEEFYLVLDLSGSTLRLMLRGALLREYPVRGLEVGRPRVLFVPRRSQQDWKGVVWSGGALDPPRDRERVELVAVPLPPGAKGNEEPAPAIPPPPEDVYEIPKRFLVRFEEQFALEVRPEGAATAGWGAWWSDRLTVLAPRPQELRLKVVLPREAYDALYRSLPPDVKLLVLPAS